MSWNKLSMAERANIMKLAVESGIYNLDTIRSAYNEFAEGGSIHIKPSHRGRLTELKARTGKSEAELYNDGNPAHKKMVVFARNARKWKHADGGLLNTANTFAGGGKKKKSGALGNQAFQNYLNQALQEDNTFNTPGGIKFLTDIAYAESRNNPYATHNSGASGIFQTMPENTSKGAYGNPILQFRDMFRLTKSNLNYLKKHLTKKDWDRAAKLGIDEYGLLAGAHLGGVGGVVNALRGIKNAKDSNGTSVMSYMTRFSQSGKPALGNDITANPVVMGTTPETTFTPEQYQLIYGDNPYALPTASYAEETPIWPNPYGEAVVEEPSIQTVELSPVDFTQQNANNQRRRNLDVLGYVLGSSKSNRRNGSLYNTIQMISDEDSFNPLRLLRVGDFGTPNSFAKGGNKKKAMSEYGPKDLYDGGDSSKGNHSQQMNQPNIFRKNGKYFYQESPDSEEITVTPVNTLFDDPALWTYTDNNGRLYTPRKAAPYTQGTITEKEDEGPLVEAAKNYLGELQYDINNGVPIGGKYTMPAIAASALLPLAGEAFAGINVAGIPATTWADAALTAGFGAHGLNHAINEGIDGYGDAAMTALEIAPLGRLVRPLWKTATNTGTALYNDIYIPYKISNAIDKGIKENAVITAYNRNPATKDIGNLWDYQSYLDNVFPNSKVKDVLWHGSTSKNLQTISPEYIGTSAPIKKSVGMYLAPERYTAVGYGTRGDVYPVLLNTENPFITDQFFGGISKNGVNVTKISPEVKSTLLANNDAVIAPKRGEIAFFNPDNALILGSDADVAGFRRFMSKPQITAENAASMTPEQWTAAQDAAIARGDMAEAQRLRDLHFKVSAPSTVASVNGQPLQLYHGTDATFNAFDISKYGSTDGGTFGRGIYTTPVKEYAELYGKNNMPLYMKLDNPRDYRNYNISDLISEKFAFGDDFATGNGIDGVIGRPSWKGFKGLEEWVSHNPKNIKSSLPVTYTDDGTRIPLGERDNFNINDIRYGLIPFLGLGAAGTLYGTSDK